MDEFEEYDSEFEEFSPPQSPVYEYKSGDDEKDLDSDNDYPKRIVKRKINHKILKSSNIEREKKPIKPVEVKPKIKKEKAKFGSVSWSSIVNS